MGNLGSQEQQDSEGRCLDSVSLQPSTHGKLLYFVSHIASLLLTVLGKCPSLILPSAFMNTPPPPLLSFSYSFSSLPFTVVRSLPPAGVGF